jgi:hypothetical protein
VVADAVERLLAKVQVRHRDIRAPDGVVETTGEKDPERILAHVSARTVPAVVTQCDRFGQSDVQSACLGDPGGHLRHLEGVTEPGPLMIRGEDEDLGLARQSTEGRRVQDAVPVPFEAGAPRVGLLGDGAPTPGDGPGRSGCEHLVLGRLAPRAPVGLGLGVGAEAGGGVGVRRAQALVAVPRHGGRPATTPFGGHDGGWLHGL